MERVVETIIGKIPDCEPRILQFEVKKNCEILCVRATDYTDVNNCVALDIECSPNETEKVGKSIRFVKPNEQFAKTVNDKFLGLVRSWQTIYYVYEVRCKNDC